MSYDTLNLGEKEVGVNYHVTTKTQYRIDSVTAVYDVVARAAMGGPDRGVAGIAARTVGVLGMRVRSGSVRPIAGSWREVL